MQTSLAAPTPAPAAAPSVAAPAPAVPPSVAAITSADSSSSSSSSSSVLSIDQAVNILNAATTMSPTAEPAELRSVARRVDPASSGDEALGSSSAHSSQANGVHDEENAADEKDNKQDEQEHDADQTAAAPVPLLQKQELKHGATAQRVMRVPYRATLAAAFCTMISQVEGYSKMFTPLGMSHAGFIAASAVIMWAAKMGTTLHWGRPFDALTEAAGYKVAGNFSKKDYATIVVWGGFKLLLEESVPLLGTGLLSYGIAASIAYYGAAYLLAGNVAGITFAAMIGSGLYQGLEKLTDVLIAYNTNSVRASLTHTRDRSEGAIIHKGELHPVQKLVEPVVLATLTVVMLNYARRLVMLGAGDFLKLNQAHVAVPIALFFLKGIWHMVNTPEPLSRGVHTVTSLKARECTGGLAGIAAANGVALQQDVAGMGEAERLEAKGQTQLSAEKKAASDKAKKAAFETADGKKRILNVIDNAVAAVLTYGVAASLPVSVLSGLAAAFAIPEAIMVGALAVVIVEGARAAYNVAYQRYYGTESESVTEMLPAVAAKLSACGSSTVELFRGLSCYSCCPRTVASVKKDKQGLGGSDAAKKLLDGHHAEEEKVADVEMGAASVASAGAGDIGVPNGKPGRVLGAGSLTSSASPSFMKRPAAATAAAPAPAVVAAQSATPPVAASR